MESDNVDEASPQAKEANMIRISGYREPFLFAALMGSLFGLAAAWFLSFFETNLGADLSTMGLTLLAAGVGLWFGQTCASHVYSWYDGPDQERTDVAFFVGLVVGSTIAAMYFVQQWWWSVAVPFGALFGFGGYCSMRDLDVKSVYLRRTQSKTQS